MERGGTVTLGECRGQTRHALCGAADAERMALLREGAQLVSSMPLGRLPGHATAETLALHAGPVQWALSALTRVCKLQLPQWRQSGGVGALRAARIAFDDSSLVVAALTAPRGERWQRSEWQFAVSFYDAASSSREWDQFQLCHEFMRDPACIAWQPAGAHPAVAVGCQSGICLWRVRGWGSSPSSWMSFLQDPAGAPVSALAWSPCGAFLAAAGPHHGITRVWDTDNQRSIALPNPGACPAVELAYAPTGLFLACTTACVGWWSPRAPAARPHPCAPPRRDGTLALWNAKTWQRTSLRPGGVPLGIAWDAEGALLLVACASPSGRVALHCVHCPSGLDAVTGTAPEPSLLPTVWEMDGNAADSDRHPRLGCAWDPQGGRVAVACGSPAAGKEGRVALFAAARGPAGLALNFLYAASRPLTPGVRVGDGRGTHTSPAAVGAVTMSTDPGGRKRWRWRLPPPWPEALCLPSGGATGTRRTLRRRRRMRRPERRRCFASTRCSTPSGPRETAAAGGAPKVFCTNVEWGRSLRDARVRSL